MLVVSHISFFEHSQHALVAFMLLVLTATIISKASKALNKSGK